MVNYRRWREGNVDGRPEVEPISTDVMVDESSQALACPKCKRVMTKYAIALHTTNRLDYCAHCEEVWLDGGEWELIENLAMSGYLAEVFTQPWQRRIRESISHEREADRLKELLAGDYDKFVELRNWLNGHPSRDKLIVYLQRKSR